MTTKDSLRIAITTTLLLWLGLMFAPALLAAEAWQELEHPSLDALFASNKQPAVSYHSVRLEPVSVWFPGDDIRAARHAEELRQLTGDHLQAAIVARGLTVADEPAGDVGNKSVIVRVQLIDLRSLPGDGDVPVWADDFRFRVATGRVTLVAELIDAATGRTVLHMADLQDSESADTPAAVDRMLQHWGEIVAQNAESPPGPLQLARAR